MAARQGKNSPSSLALDVVQGAWRTPPSVEVVVIIAVEGTNCWGWKLFLFAPFMDDENMFGGSPALGKIRHQEKDRFS